MFAPDFASGDDGREASLVRFVLPGVGGRGIVGVGARRVTVRAMHALPLRPHPSAARGIDARLLRAWSDHDALTVSQNVQNPRRGGGAPQQP